MQSVVYTRGISLSPCKLATHIVRMDPEVSVQVLFHFIFRSIWKKSQCESGTSEFCTHSSLDYFSSITLTIITYKLVYWWSLINNSYTYISSNSDYDVQGFSMPVNTTTGRWHDIHGGRSELCPSFESHRFWMKNAIVHYGKVFFSKISHPLFLS